MKSLNKFLTRKITRVELEKFISENSSDRLTLDLGCSNSPYSHYFKNRIGLDVNKGRGVDVVADAHDLPFEDGKFDIILCTEVLEHLHSPHVAISEMKRVLKVGGKLILTTRFIFPIHDAPGDYFRYTKYGLRYLFKDWNVISLVEEVGTKDAFAVLLQRIGFQTDLLGGMATKIMVFALARLINAMPSLIRDEFGDIRKQSRENNILTSGYYLVANKK
ncbi:MAG: hypothetical protein A2568_03515 [Candidatus Yanofskybacteria bacterium RIFOXYD1_FULL_44_17]|uniref:Methyltransferase type 11 domain-containing protein n=1 Tax=Candidatus Yanofskybacteria bacterium GW2011_GWE2_40_11 TaxID=1619033 RepID=A0A0G0T0T6_9BACT|nr:MAG: hypothetical protein UT69_C0005G0010 [Candidatus Yanofskybacteria bacterium GW2011_GWE1_40_10]KKR40735.1 MAG: hypothetical protein UT75_C0005G0043 [Candidatus Yanofskybacteria bacterium GW2011_GWE2_40_11]OGN36018.1 MAG: hypothetical protein A2207_03095 [Candidatus Yanofskybacteria bacterium RIFOXYA1_FULL_44_17]OGN36380.1 MAG: hypothetical protein A2241_01390 [Candidatus Yanofskybacteria bacterium RIFOXYA2_FULL_45_28]OGN37441.1 MAG: hypothetical protein A2371_00545 [Candidatus Yanofskyba